MKKLSYILGVGMAVFALSTTSCQPAKKDQKPTPGKTDDKKTTEKTYQKVEIDNAELLACLKKQGFEVNGKQLTLNEKVTGAKHLNLSSAMLSSLKGLEAFTALTSVNLSSNNFGDTFDFASLPKNIVSVNLDKNEIYHFVGLLNKDNSAVARTLDSLALPFSASYDINTLPVYLKNKGAKVMTIANREGNQETYSLLREASSPACLEYIKQKFPSALEGDKINILAELNGREPKNTISVSQNTEQDFSALAYIINNPTYMGKSVNVYVTGSKQFNMGYLNIPARMQGIKIQGYNFELSLPEKSDLRYVEIIKNNTLSSLDLSKSASFLNKDAKSSFLWTDGLVLVGCKNLSSLNLPKRDETKALEKIYLFDLPKLSTFNSENIGQINRAMFMGLSSLKDLNLSNASIKVESDDSGDSGDFNDFMSLSSVKQVPFIVDKAVSAFPGVQSFIKKNKASLSADNDKELDFIKDWNKVLGTNLSSFDYNE